MVLATPGGRCPGRRYFNPQFIQVYWRWLAEPPAVGSSVARATARGQLELRYFPVDTIETSLCGSNVLYRVMQFLPERCDILQDAPLSPSPCLSQGRQGA